jgi:hypothetical protein
MHTYKPSKRKAFFLKKGHKDYQETRPPARLSHSGGDEPFGGAQRTQHYLADSKARQINHLRNNVVIFVQTLCSL